MPAEAGPVRRHPGLRWHASGQSSLSGALLTLSRDLDRLFLAWAAECGAAEHAFPPCIAAADLAKIDYFRSFPHHASFAVTLDADAANLRRFADACALDERGAVRLTELAPVGEVLTPAACYHVYPAFSGQKLAGPAHITTRATCFRREERYAPLERQWSFAMREIVCLGTADEVKAFLERYRARIERFFARIGLPIAWQAATDPFFDPRRNPKYLLQKLDPVKTEMVFGGSLAIGSINFHRNYFGEAFAIDRDGEPAFSGCVAFGIERWLHAWLERFGAEERGWPRLEAGDG